MVVGGYLAVSDNPRKVENARAGDAISQILKNCSTGSCVHHLRVVDIFDSENVCQAQEHLGELCRIADL